MMNDHTALPDHYTPDGSRNHEQFQKRGSVNSPRIRAHPPKHSYSYGDGEDGPLWHHPHLDGLPSARKILVELFQKVTPRRNERASQMLMAFGHFVARDTTRTVLNKTQPMPIECDMIETRGPFCPSGQEYMEFFRASRRLPYVDEGSENFFIPTDTGEPLNSATAWLDMDHIYGNSLLSSSDYLKFRTGEGGQMKLDNTTGLPPYDNTTGLYLVQDDPMRRLPLDLGMTATFLHYHNKRAEHYQKLNSTWDDEALFWKARMDTIAVYQSVFEEKYVPAVLGMPLSQYKGYDPEQDASIDVFFSTCSFRYGHSGMSSVLRLLDKNVQPLPQDPILMRDVFNRTEQFVQLIGGGRIAMSAVMLGLAHDATRAPDASFVDDMSLFMLASVPINIQRGRDNGLPSYNEAREWFNLSAADSYIDLAGDDQAIADILESLYGKDNIDLVDPYVGAMLESPLSEDDVLGPLNQESLRDQFERLRNGDRLYYRNRLTFEEVQNLPTLSDLIRDAWGEDQMSLFPDDIFSILDNGIHNYESPMSAGYGAVELFEGDLIVNWKNNEEGYIDFTIQSTEEIRGYIGLGWGARTMLEAEMWFCESIQNSLINREDSCVATFSCCVAPGSKHARPICDGGKDYLSVLSSCISESGSELNVRAQRCSSAQESNCFPGEADIDFIAAYNPDSVNSAHGFSRRTGGSTNIAQGTSLSCSSDSAQAGLFALHGASLLFAWLVIAPIAIYVVRYLKDKPWRLRVHITLVGIIGGLMLTLVTAALVSVEGTAFGTEDASGATFSNHKIFGLSIMFFVIFMITTGELRRRRTLTKKTQSVALEQAVIMSHRLGGLILVGCAWTNCYTGLLQISPYESDSVEITLFSSTTVSLGYDLEIFGFIRKYLFIPWVCLVILIFVITEIRVCRARGDHLKSTNMNELGGGILTLENEKNIATMTTETFLFLTKHGSSLSIIDGYVIDIGTFMDVHPGGTNVLKFAIGCDITDYFLGELDINGLSHHHSPRALRALKPLVKASLSDSNGEDARRSTGGRKSFFNMGRKPNNLGDPTSHGQVFRSAKIVKYELLSSMDTNQKITVRLCVSLKREKRIDTIVGHPLPTSTFVFRAVDSTGNAFDRPYTTSHCYLSQQEIRLKTLNSILPLHSRQAGQRTEMIVYEFFITLVPDGKMSANLAKMTVGKRIMVKGPLANKPFLQRIREQPCNDLCLLIQGTGITAALPLVDYYIRSQSPPPKVTLVWFVRERCSEFEKALALKNREDTSEHFRYLIISDMDVTVDDTMSKNKQSFLRRYRSENIHHDETVDALLSWVSDAGKDEPMSQSEDDDIDQFDTSPGLNPESAMRHLDPHQGLLVALCGHPSFENDMSVALQNTMLEKDQIIKFPEGSTPVNQLSEFVADTSVGSGITLDGREEEMAVSAQHDVEGDAAGPFCTHVGPTSTS